MECWSAGADVLPADRVHSKVCTEKTLRHIVGAAWDELHCRQQSCCCPRSLPPRWGDSSAQPHLLPLGCAAFCGLRPTCELV